ncbi:hypothetical protein BU26DRAFT_332192 [Trematosphaeria pertusa]|uniref:Uncharacterized protein n=1 Tax=Trematosphaeria pertusa TaxID=390896 RepID=A0A6A6IE78_9PLEO|nr:uncharacterized protein BU26DRAFT_332192 [Trematosphaeria pertusa]KAF2248368.1 hypothetical protein BU26DRAFT_332192 [Trematosphaeria pertusa]
MRSPEHSIRTTVYKPHTAPPWAPKYPPHLQSKAQHIPPIPTTHLPKPNLTPTILSLTQQHPTHSPYQATNHV